MVFFVLGQSVPPGPRHQGDAPTKLTDEATSDKLARAISPQTSRQEEINDLAERIELAMVRDEIPSDLEESQQETHLPWGEFQPGFLRVARLADAVEWARSNGFPVRDELLKRLPPNSTQSPPPRRGGKWPWGDYETPLLKILAEAVNRFCLTGDYPKKDTGEVVRWVKERMELAGLPPSYTLADKLETIISPRLYSHHRQRKQR